MVSLGESPRPIKVENALGNYGPGKTDDKPFVHQRDGIYYLSYGCFYAVSYTSVYGLYKFIGTVIETASLTPLQNATTLHQLRGGLMKIFAFGMQAFCI